MDSLTAGEKEQRDDGGTLVEIALAMDWPSATRHEEKVIPIDFASTAPLLVERADVDTVINGVAASGSMLH